MRTDRAKRADALWDARRALDRWASVRRTPYARGELAAFLIAAARDYEATGKTFKDFLAALGSYADEIPEGIFV